LSSAKAQVRIARGNSQGRKRFDVTKRRGVAEGKPYGLDRKQKRHLQQK
jgi:hypothetical protein